MKLNTTKENMNIFFRCVKENIDKEEIKKYGFES